MDTFNLTPFAEDDPIFCELNSLKPTIAKTLQPIVPALVQLFSSLQSKLISEFKTLLDNTVDSMKRECLSVCRDKDQTIETLKKQVFQLEEKLEDTEAYERRDTVILSGSVPSLVSNEETSKVVVDLVKTKFPNIEIARSDISVSHRLQSKRPNKQGITYPPNIYVKLVRRELKHQLIDASKKQPKESRDKLFVNESLTPKRTRIRQTLLNMKKKHGDVIRGVSSFEGSVFAYTPQPAGSDASTNDGSRRRRDLRHRVNTDEELRKFCREFLKKPLDEFISASHSQ